MCLGVVAASAAWAAPPDTDAVRKTAAEVVSRPDYRLESGLNEDTQALWQTILGWILKPIFWLFELLNGLPMPIRVLVTILLSVLLVVLVIHMVWSFVAALRQTKIDVTNRATREQSVDPAELEASAELAAANADFLKASRLLFKATLIRIERSEKRKFRLGITNRELLRRYRTSSLAEPLSRFVELIDRKWYGGEDCASSDYDQCCSAHSRIRSLIQGSLNAVSA